MSEVRISDGHGGWIDLMLVRDAQTGRPIWNSKVLDPVAPSFNLGDATYANFAPKVAATFAQADLSKGAGKATQEVQNDPDFGRYDYTENADASQAGMIQPGPEVVVLASPANAEPLESLFTLAGVPYLVQGRIISKYDPSTGQLTQVKDLGVGKSGYDSAAFFQMGPEAADQASAGTGASDRVDGTEKLLAQSFTPSASRFLSRIDLQLARTDVVAVQQLTLNGGPTGGTFTLAYSGFTTGALAYNADAPTVQAALRTLPDLGSVTVTKAGNIWTVTFTGVTGAALPLAPDSSALTGGTNPSVTVVTTRAGSTILSPVELAIQTDLNGNPSGSDLAVASVPSKSVPTAAGTVSFRFDQGESVYLTQGEKYWVVLRATGAATTAYVAWTRGAADSYANGKAVSSASGGDAWNDVGADYYFTTYAKAVTEVAFVGQAQGDALQLTADGTTYTAAAVQGKLLAVYEDLLIRDVRASASGAIQWSNDGVNWSAPLVLGDPSVPVTAILPLSQAVIVVKEDGIWAIDPDQDPAAVDALYWSGRSSDNGRGSCVWNNAAYIPFDGRLMSVAGDFGSVFTVQRSIGPESLPEWSAPWGASRIVAVAGDRYCLYAVMKTAGSFKLWKSYSPNDKQWHGSIADLGTPAAIHAIAVWDAGGDNNPLLFCTTTNNDVVKILLSRTMNPAADPAYRYSTAVGEVVFPRAHGNFHVSPKAWLYESVTFAEEAAGSYVELMYDVLDGAGWRVLERLTGTGTLSYPDGLSSRLLDRKLLIAASSATAAPLVLCSALTSAVRPSSKLRTFSFVARADYEIAQNAITDPLGFDAGTISERLQELAQADGTRILMDPDRKEWRVLIQNVEEQLVEIREGGSRKEIAVEAVTC